MERRLLLAIVLALPACGEAGRKEPRATPSYGHDASSGEVRARIVPRGEPVATMRSGANVPVSLPRGFTLYPGAKLVSSTLVERGDRRRVLVVFETAGSPAEVMLFYRAQAGAAAATVLLDVGGEERASLGGRLAEGREFAISVRRAGGTTRVEWSAG